MPKPSEKELSLEQEKETFVADIAEVLASMDQRMCSLKELSKAYRDLKGHNVNIMIDKVAITNR